jgi:hypothetical protein
MTVKTAALSSQQLESAPAAIARRRPQRRALIAFVALFGAVELAWVILLFEFVKRFV